MGMKCHHAHERKVLGNKEVLYGVIHVKITFCESFFKKQLEQWC